MRATYNRLIGSHPSPENTRSVGPNPTASVQKFSKTKGSSVYPYNPTFAIPLTCALSRAINVYYHGTPRVAESGVSLLVTAVTTVTIGTVVTLVTIVTDVTDRKQGNSQAVVTTCSMADKAKLVEWNLRDFPADLKGRCQRLAIGEDGKRLKDADIVAKLIRQALGLSQPTETEVLNSEHADRQRPVRRGPFADAKDSTKEGVRDKGRKEGT